MKLATKISLSFLITSIMLTSIAVSIIYINVKESLEDGIYSNLRSVALSRTRHIETVIKEDKSRIELLARTSPLPAALDKIARNPRDSNKSVVELNLMLKEIIEVEPEAFEIFIIGRDGRVIASTNEGDPGKDRSSFLNNGKDSFVTDVNYSETTGERGYSISAPIFKDGTNEILGLLIAGFKMDGLNKITVNRTGLGKTGEVFIVNKDGYMITPSRFEEDTFLKGKAGTFCKLSYVDVDGLPGKEKLTAFPNYKNVMVLGTHEFIQDLQWCVLAEIDMEEALAPLNKISNILFGVLFIVPVLAWLIGTLVSRVVTSSLKELQSGTEIIGRGNLEHEIGIYSEDEIGQLSRAFDKMTKDLKKTTTSVNLLNREIMERKQAEKALKKAKEKAETANASKSQFLANISHELRTPMNSVLGFAGLMKETPMNETQKDYVQTISSSGRVLLDIINNILDLSKIETGEVEFENIAFDLKLIAENVIKIIKPRLENSDLKMVFEISDDMPVHFMGDPTCIHQIFLNLLSNATKFTDQGEIKLSLSEEKSFDVPLEDISRVKIVVKDTGIGISGDKQKTIFDAFIQEDSSTTRQYGGTGLGLTIVKRLVKAMNGEISVLSNKGEGSEFSVVLPLRKNSGSSNIQALQSNNPDKSSFKELKALVVEDDSMNLMLFNKILLRLGCNPETAADGEEALAKLKAKRYDIIFMDVMIPVIDGVKVTEIVRRDIDIGTPIIGITAAAMDEDREKAISAGMNDYLVKPVDPGEIESILLKWVLKKDRK
jgi:signal transduction histidine kinase/CheY-like chemotaxis protein